RNTFPGIKCAHNPDVVGKVGTQVVANISQEKETLMELNEKLGHPSIQKIESLLKDSISKTEKANFECKSCLLSKITKQPFKECSKTVSKPFKRIHLDLIGPIDLESSLKHQFILTFLDNYSGYLAGFPLTLKDETMDVFTIQQKSAQMGVENLSALGPLSTRLEFKNNSGMQFSNHVAWDSIKFHGKDVLNLRGSSSTSNHFLARGQAHWSQCCLKIIQDCCAVRQNSRIQTCQVLEET
ncbi:hypothetical protein VP01_7981g1, partial [Puccinia sorghi]